MRRLFCMLVLLAGSISSAQAGIDEAINSATAPIASFIGQVVFFKIPIFGAQLPVVVLWLVVGAVFFTFYMGFINLRGFKHAIELVRGDYADPDSHGEVSHLQRRFREQSASVTSVVSQWRLRSVARVLPSG